ncbi:YdaU family protein [Methylobacterium sp. E-065]|uniref:DUF1376 domain-containing protein n=1 Tax=Methylobacterium sp. E-065 TaxID=2836583 RepID=UPI001FB8DEEE|nr:DUF1376 domain-containing protein [Methylobacterium sp. E-065]MCJ2022155.1 YdaU family protein [Methylobacterium sp. E-065]
MKGEFYKMDFRAWNVGTIELTLEQEAAYLRLCHAMYDVGGPVPNSTRFLQSIFRCVKRRWNGTPDRRAIGTPSQAGYGTVRLS